MEQESNFSKADIFEHTLEINREEASGKITTGVKDTAIKLPVKKRTTRQKFGLHSSIENYRRRFYITKPA